MGNTKSELVFIILGFYAILSVIMGFVGGTLNQDLGVEQKSYGENSSFFKSIFNNVITGYSIIPAWANLILFGVPSAVLLWIILSSLPTLNGGG